MTAEQLDEFAFLWTSEAANYVLVSVQPSKSDLQHCVIVHRGSRSAKLIEDPELALEVMERMVEAGVPIVDKMPEEES